MSETWTDGNSMGGPLREVFAVDLTTAVGRCVSCGNTAPLAEGRVFGPAPGLVLRCQRCGQPLLRLVRGPRQAWLDLRGLAYLAVTEPDRDE
jgi:NAD-dependent SIR2 family protein deacetylase